MIKAAFGNPVRAFLERRKRSERFLQLPVAVNAPRNIQSRGQQHRRIRSGQRTEQYDKPHDHGNSRLPKEVPARPAVKIFNAGQTVFPFPSFSGLLPHPCDETAKQRIPKNQSPFALDRDATQQQSRRGRKEKQQNHEADCIRRGAA